VVPLPVLPGGGAKVRKSQNSRRRAAVLIGLHVLIAGHVVHWLVAGQTLSPVEPSESMYTLNQGHLNAGFLFFAAALLATLVFGRFVCGWGCHFLAYQDFCLWLLKKLRIKPKAFRSRYLVLAPLALALYMFVWPTVHRWWMGYPAPPLTNHLLKSDFWETFPGPVIAVLTFLVAGMVIVYFLGAKGFCTYACPYGGFFAPVEKLAPGRIRVTDACHHCGHCTSVCTSNVRVHEEVARFGMVVDPGCMKCMDCVSVCPNDALYFGFGKPSLAARPAAGGKPVPYDFSRAEELVMAAVGLAALLVFRGLYDKIPLLLAMALAAMTAYVTLKAWHLAAAPNVRFQNWRLKGGGRLHRAGGVFAAAFVLLALLTAHGAAVQYKAWRGRAHFAAAAIGDEVWTAENAWWEHASPTERTHVTDAIAALEWVDRWGLWPTYTVLKDTVWLFLAVGQVDRAEGTLRRMAELEPRQAEPRHGLGAILQIRGRPNEAATRFREALEIDPGHARARTELATLLDQTGRFDEVRALNQAALRLRPPDVHWSLDLGRRLMGSGRRSEAHDILSDVVAAAPQNASGHWLLGVCRVESGRVPEGIGSLNTAAGLEPGSSGIRYDLGMALLRGENTEAAVGQLREAVRLKSDFGLAHYNLAVALAMSGKPAEALPHAKEAVRLLPNDPDAAAFLELLKSR
jgi:polyferredoxin/Flp pilus assembly protein TadD